MKKVEVEIIILSTKNFKSQLKTYEWIVKNSDKYGAINNINIPVDNENPIIYFSVASNTFWRGTEDLLTYGDRGNVRYGSTSENFIKIFREVKKTLAPTPRKEMRVYLIDTRDKLSFDRGDCMNVSDEVFMLEAENQGTAYTLDGFQSYVNAEPFSINAKFHWIRFVEVETFD